MRHAATQRLPALHLAVASVLALAGVALAGCPSPPEPVDLPSFPTPDPVPEPTPPPPEECNGLDDDGDGAVDEGFADRDGDGLADCVDPACVPSVAPPTVLPETSCTHLAPNVPETYDLVVEGFLQDPDPPPGCGFPMGSVFVLQSTDDNGDGVVDGADDLDVAINGACLGPGLNVPHGLIFEPAASRVTSLPAGTTILSPIPDVDGDGAPDFAGMSLTYTPEITLHFRAMNHAGETLWESAVPYDSTIDGTGYWYPSAADLDADGTAELAWYRRLFDGETGSVLATANVPPGTRSTQHTIIADLDLDGAPEILTSDGAFDAAGALLWALPSSPGWGHALPVQVDGDPEAEVVVVSGEGLWILDEHGEVADWTPLADLAAAPPCLADVDGDGAPEVVGMVWATTQLTELRALRLDGTELWRHGVTDHSGAASCGAFDFEGDGRFEILYQDETEMTIRDGLTGDVLYRYEDLSSGTVIEYPVAVDIDKDGSAEVVFSVPVTQAGLGGVAILGSPRNLWMPGADAWPAWDYRIDNVGLDASVPLHPPATWRTHNSVHAAPQSSRPFADLRPVVDGSCVSGCEWFSQVRVSFAVVNEGLVEVPAGVPVVVRAAGVPGGQALWSGSLPAPLAPGTIGPSWEYVTTRSELPAGGLAIIVDESDGFGLVVECEEADNRVVWADPCE